MTQTVRQEAIFDAIAAAVAKIRGPQDPVTGVAIGDSTLLWGYEDSGPDCLDLDSLEVLEVVLELEDSLGLTLDDEADLSSISTVGDLARGLTEVDW